MVRRVRVRRGSEGGYREGREDEEGREGREKDEIGPYSEHCFCTVFDLVLDG